MNNKKNEAIYYVKGMHCASCEINIEKRLLELDNVKAVEASLNKGIVVVEFEREKPDVAELSRLFGGGRYFFYDDPVNEGAAFTVYDFLVVLAVFAVIFAAYLLADRFGFSTLINVNDKSSLPSFLFFGLLAGVSSCAALVGGIVLSMSKQWAGTHKNSDAFTGKILPHLIFNAGRIISYGLFGAVLGLVGNWLQISTTFSSFLVFAVSLIMIFLALDMLGVPKLARFQLAMPRFITRYVADEGHFKGRYMPFFMGAATFFLPCGFTLTVQSLALVSADYLQGALILAFFAIGTSPSLLAIGISSAKFLDSPKWSGRFLKVAGALVLFFAVFNINNQFNVFGLPSLNDVSFVAFFSKKEPVVDAEGRGFEHSTTFGDQYQNLPPIIDGKQVVKMQASVYGYSPDHIKVRSGIPVRWEIEDVGTSGCTNAIIARDLFDGRITLTPGKVSTKEFVPPGHGVYKFTCWMGMVSGVIEVLP